MLVWVSVAMQKKVKNISKNLASPDFHTQLFLIDKKREFTKNGVK